MNSGYGKTFDSAGLWSFDNDFAENIMIFGVDNSSSSHYGKRKNNVLILGEGPNYGSLLMEALDHQKIIHYTADNSFSFVNGK